MHAAFKAVPNGGGEGGRGGGVTSSVGGMGQVLLKKIYKIEAQTDTCRAISSYAMDSKKFWNRFYVGLGKIRHVVLSTLSISCWPLATKENPAFTKGSTSFIF